MKDLLGTDLAVNDTVATNISGYSDLQVGKIEKFTPKMIRVKYPGNTNASLRYSSQVVLIAEEVAIIYWLKTSQ